MRPTSASLCDRVNGPSRCSITPLSAFSAAKGGRSSSRQALRRSRAVCNSGIARVIWQWETRRYVRLWPLLPGAWSVRTRFGSRFRTIDFGRVLPQLSALRRRPTGPEVFRREFLGAAQPLVSQVDGLLPAMGLRDEPLFM
jgi:hypothetical protein